jgi:dipeptidyl aminopeptidase/acylaminoacyl peptidase
MNKRILLILLAIVPVIAFGQKAPLSHAEYDGWKNLGSTSITDNGKWISYEINPQEGDGVLYYYDIKSAKLESIERGTDAKFAPGTGYMVYAVKPSFAETRSAKKDKKKADEMPKDNLGIVNLTNGDTELIERVKSFSIASEGEPWMAYLMEKPLPKKPEKKAEGEKEESGENAPAATARPTRGGGAPGGARKSEGTELVIKNPLTNKEFKYSDVTEYSVADNGSVIGFVQVTSDSTKVDHYSVSLFSTKEQKENVLFKGDGTLKKLTLDKSGKNAAFIYTSDTSKVKVYRLYHSGGSDATEVVNSNTAGMVKEWSVSENGNLSFDEAGTMLLFGTAEKPVEEVEDTLLADEKYRLDIWSWNDPQLQPQQKLSLQRDNRKTYTAVYHIGDKKMVQLADPDMPDVRVPTKGESTKGVGISNLEYQIFSSWDANRYTDYYHVDLKTGKRTLLMKKAPSSVELSPSGKYLVYWCIESKQWFVKPTAGGEAISLTAGLGVDFFDELHDSPSEPRPHGTAGWIEGEKYLLINDRYDIWKMDVTGKEKPILLTNGFGRKNNITFRYNSVEGGGGGRFGRQSDKIYIGDKETVYLDAFNNYSKQAGLFTLKINKASDPLKLDMGDYSYRSIVKAKEADLMIFQRGTYKEYPELYVSNTDLTGAKVISNTNPQQSQYNWGTVELVEWMSFDGQQLQGLLYKPEDFDPTKKYPMVAYFYERSSDGLHNYMAPAPSASTINRTYAVSNGYLIFVPDIPYVEGYPGQSAYNAVVSGTYSMLDQFDFIDSKRLGLDGQSWGGYQIAYLITQTDLYACAFSGAPVSNMTSAYGGIRWGSGMSRMFQYEETQSRIGGTLWEKPIQYIENSPIFFVPKINTPVMIMHNDADGAVPWYQGIEFIVALRRLGKPAWMVSYNDEDHNLTKRPNRKDLSIRKMQFFDHYLMSKPMPYWMEHGISQIEKSKGVDGYELMK